jgi:hypothetical protein
MSEIAHSIKHRATPKDVFYTPADLVQVHLDLVKPYIRDGDVIYDAFYGKGAYYNAFPSVFKNSTFQFSEIEMGKDFFEFNESIDAIVSNPPYSMIDKVLEKSVALDPHTISYLIGFHNLTTKRIEYMNQQGYGLVVLHLTKVMKWYGMSVICIFCKGGSNCISFDRKVHH